MPSPSNKKELPYFAMNVRERRLKQGISRNTLAYRAKISPEHLTNIEEGRQLMRLPAYKRLAVALGYAVPPLLE